MFLNIEFSEAKMIIHHLYHLISWKINFSTDKAIASCNVFRKLVNTYSLGNASMRQQCCVTIAIVRLV